MTRRKWFMVHGWLGLTAGLMLFVICWSGSIAVFSCELDWLLNPLLRRSGPSAEMNWTAAHRQVAKQFPGDRVFQVARPPGPRFAAEVLLRRSGDRQWRVYVDPRTGEVLGDSSYFNVQRFFRSFHMNLFFLSSGMDLGFWGYRLVESFAFVLLVSLVSSLSFYRGWWRGFFRVGARRGVRALWSNVHRLSGLWGLWFMLVIAITGIWYLVEEFVPGSPDWPVLDPAPAMVVAPLPLTDLVRTAGSALPAFEVTRVNLPLDAGEPVAVYGYDGALLVRDRAAVVWLDPRDGAVVRVQRTSDLNALQRWIDTADPVHFGNFGGLWSKAVWFVFGLALSGLSLTGAYMAAVRQRRQGRESIRRPVFAAYGVTITILLVATVGGWFEIRDYGPPMNGMPRFPEVAPGVVTFIAAWVASTVTALTLWMWRLK